MVQVVVLSANGESRTMRTQAFNAGAATGLTVAKALRKTKPLELIGVWTLEDSTLQLWGAKEGKAGTENKHELPPPHDEILLFGDAIVCSVGGDLVVEAWNEFYEEAFGGFESLDSEDDADVEAEVEEAAEAEEAEEAEEEAEEEEAEEAEEAEEVEEAEEAEEVEEAEEYADVDGDFDDDGGAGKRRSARRRTAAESEYRRMEMGSKLRVKFPQPIGKRAPRWQTAPELVAEDYQI